MKRLSVFILALLFPIVAHADLRNPAPGSVATTSTNSWTAAQTFSSATITNPRLVGTTTNDNAAVGNYGEYLSSAIPVGQAVTSAATTQWQDVVSTVATSGGDWDVTAQGCQTLNGSVSTEFIVGIGTTTGNVIPSGNYGDDKEDGLPSTAAADSCRTIANLRMSIASALTFYLKQNSTFSAGSPKIYGRISARRIR